MVKKGDVELNKVSETEKWLKVSTGNLLTYMEQKYASGVKLFFEKHPEWFEINKDGIVSVQKKPDNARDEHKKRIPVVSGDQGYATNAVGATKLMFRKHFPYTDKSKNALTKEPQSEKFEGEGQLSNDEADGDFTSEAKMEEVQYIKTVRRSSVSTAKVSKDTTSQEITKKTNARKLVTSKTVTLNETSTTVTLNETTGAQTHEAKDFVPVEEKDSQKEVPVDSKLGTKRAIVEDEDSGEKVNLGENKPSISVPQLAQISSDDKTFKKPAPVRQLRRRTTMMNRNFNRKPELKKRFMKSAFSNPVNTTSLDKSTKNTSNVMKDILTEEENVGIDCKLEKNLPAASGKQEYKGGTTSPTDRSVGSAISGMKDNKTMNATDTKDISPEENLGSETNLEEDKTTIEEEKGKPSSPNKKSAAATFLRPEGKKNLKLMESEKPNPEDISDEDFDDSAKLQVIGLPVLEIGVTEVKHSLPSKRPLLSAKGKKLRELEKIQPEEILSENDFDSGTEIVTPFASQLKKAEPEERDSESKCEFKEVASVGQRKKGKCKLTRRAKTMRASRLQRTKMLNTARLKIAKDITSHHILRRKHCAQKSKRNLADEAIDLHELPEISLVLTREINLPSANNATGKSGIEAEFEDNSVVAKPVNTDNLDKDVPYLMSVKEYEHVDVPKEPKSKIEVATTSQLKENIHPGTRRSPRAQNRKSVKSSKVSSWSDSDSKIQTVVLDVTTGVALQVESGKNKASKTFEVEMKLEDTSTAELVPAESMDNFVADSSTLEVGEHTSAEFETTTETTTHNLKKNKQCSNVEVESAKPDPVVPQMEVQEKLEENDEISTLTISGKIRQVSRRSRGCRRRASERQKVKPGTNTIPARVQHQRRGC